MSRKRLIKQLKEKNPQLNRHELENVFNFFSEAISNALKKGKVVEIRNLGRFYFQDCDITSLGDSKLISMNEYVLESTLSREYEDEIFGFQRIEYIVIEYKTNDRYEKTEKIRKSFF